MPRVYPPIEQKPTEQHHALPPSLIEIVSGFTAGIVSTLAVHPFDVVKTRLQIDQAHKPQVGGSLHIVRDIWKNEGITHGFYRGIAPNMIGNSISWGLYFMWYGNIKDILHTYRGEGQLTSADYFVASGVSGLLTAVFTNPIWVIKTRMLSTSRNAPGAYASTMEGTRDIWRREGIKGFYRGLVPSLFGVSHGAIQFMAYEQLKIWRAAKLAGHSVADIAAGARSHLPVHKMELSNWDFLLLSGISKIFAGTFTYPYQVVRARLQSYNADSTYLNARDVVKQVYKREGINGFYKGLGPNIVRVLPSTCVTFLVYENMKIWLPHVWGQPHDVPEPPPSRISTSTISPSSNASATSLTKLTSDPVKELTGVSTKSQSGAVTK